MSFFSKLSNWFTDTIVAPISGAPSTLYNNTIGSAINSTTSTVSNAGGGLGAALLTIPVVGGAASSVISGVQSASDSAISAAASLTPAQIAAANDAAAKEKADAEAAEAAKQGLTIQEYRDQQAKLAEPPYTINDFFNTVFTSTLYLSIFLLIMFLGLLGSSLAANAALNKPVAFRVYYMIYGFILFPISIGMGIYNHMQKKQLFHAIWAPLHETYSTNKFLNVLLFPFIYRKPGTAVSHFSSSLITKHPGSRHLATTPSLPTFEPTSV